MEHYKSVAIVTLVALLVYVYMGLRVGRGRTKFNVPAPAISGHEEFDRLFRVQANTLEWLPLFLVPMWLFALYWNEKVAAGVGLVWIVGRILYMTGYSKAASSRSTGFGIQALATGVLLFGALGRIIYLCVMRTA
jgi:glutathione S-transferase